MPIIQCVGVICFRGDEVLLVKRGTAPRKGDWSIPGGRIEPGESQVDAARRELFEETGVTAKLGPKVELVEACFENKDYHLHDFIATWISGEPRAGDDAAEARFYRPHDLPDLGMWPKTLDVIETARKLRG